MKRFIYVSGPSCSGKSTLSKKIKEIYPFYEHVEGDEFWNALTDLSFNERIEMTAKMILKHVEEIKSDHVLLEWVPCYGSFFNKLSTLCIEKDYDFNHIVLHAPEELLKQRKIKRDGDDQLGPTGIEYISRLESSHVFNSSEKSTDEILNVLKPLIEL